MDRFAGKVAIVTGASAGIGAATVKVLVEVGMNVVGLARRKEKLENLAKQLNGNPGKLYALKTDITKEEEIVEAFKWTSENVGFVHVLINNAGLIPNTTLVDGDSEKWRKALDTNVLGMAIASREAIKIMRENNIDGHIVNVNSVWGRFILSIPRRNVYPATKYAVTAMTETLRLELIRLGSRIKVSSISPGATDSELLVADDLPPRDPNYIILKAEDIANGILYILGTPLHVQVTELTIRPIWEKN